MKIFKDKNLTQELVEVLDFGIVPVGDTKQFKFYILNDSNFNVYKLEFIVSNSELKIIKAPKELMFKESGELIIEWKCSVEIEESLKARLHIKGKGLTR